MIYTFHNIEIYPSLYRARMEYLMKIPKKILRKPIWQISDQNLPQENKLILDLDANVLDSMWVQIDGYEYMAMDMDKAMEQICLEIP